MNHGLLHKEVGQHIELPRHIIQRDLQAQACFARSVVTVLTDPVNNVFEPAQGFWKHAGVPESDIDLLLNADGELIYHLDLDRLENLLNQAPVEVFATEVGKMLEPLYRPIQPSLDQLAPSSYGFNNHEYHVHIMDVYRNIRRLMKLAKAGDLETKLAILGALVHDSGNPYGRSIHSLVVDYLLAAITKSERYRETEMAVVVLAAMTHDEPMAIPLLQQALKQSSNELGSIDYQHFLELYAKLNTRIASALRISDKVLAAHPNRLQNTKELDASALIKDKHFLVSSLFAFRGMERVNNAFRVNIAFSLAPEELLRKIPALGKPRSNHQGHKLDLPANMTKKMRKDDPMTHYFHQAHAFYWEIHFGRMELLVVDAFNLFPDIDEVQIVFSDSEGYGGIPTAKIHEARHVFHKQQFVTQLEKLKR